MNTQSTQIYRFNAIPIKIPMVFFAEMEKLILKFIWNCKKILKKENEVGRLRLPNIKTYHKAMVIKAVWYWHKNRVQKWAHSFMVNWFSQGYQNFQWRKNSLKQMVLEQLNIHMQKNEVIPLLHTIYKNELKMEQRPT